MISEVVQSLSARVYSRWRNGSGGGSLNYAVALQGAHTPSNNPLRIPQFQAFIAAAVMEQVWGFGSL